MSNEAGPTINNMVLEAITQNWRRQGNLVETHQFPLQLGLPNGDFDLNEPGSRWIGSTRSCWS